MTFKRFMIPARERGSRCPTVWFEQRVVRQLAAAERSGRLEFGPPCSGVELLEALGLRWFDSDDSPESDD